MKRKEKKLLKHCKILSLIMAVIVLAMSFGCQRPMTTKEREERLKELLKDKYGEEFEVRELYVTGAVEAWCYPVNDPTMIIKVKCKLDMEEIGMDNYIQVIICRQIDCELTPAFQQIFTECYLSSNNSYGNTNDFFDYYDKNSINMKSFAQYVQKKGTDDIYSIGVFVDIDRISSNNTFFEYEEINRIIKDFQKNGDNTSVFVDIFFCDSKNNAEAKKAIGKYHWQDSESSETDIYDVIKRTPKIEIYFGRDNDSYLIINGERNDYDFQSYKTLREEILNE